MRHRISGRKLNRTSSHRKSMLANMAIALVINEQICTTLPKAKELRPYIERLVTKAKNPDLSSRRRIHSIIKDNLVVEKLIKIIGTRYIARPGGYTRILKAGPRHGDNAPIAYIEFVDRDINAKGSMSNNSANAKEII